MLAVATRFDLEVSLVGISGLKVVTPVRDADICKAKGLIALRIFCLGRECLLAALLEADNTPSISTILFVIRYLAFRELLRQYTVIIQQTSMQVLPATQI